MGIKSVNVSRTTQLNSWFQSITRFPFSFPAIFAFQKIMSIFSQCAVIFCPTKDISYPFHPKTNSWNLIAKHVRRKNLWVDGGWIQVPNLRILCVNGLRLVVWCGGFSNKSASKKLRKKIKPFEDVHVHKENCFTSKSWGSKTTPIKLALQQLIPIFL